MKLIKSLYLILKSQSLVRMSSDPYSTHIPILVALSLVHRLEKIVEYGSGFNSTLLFLNRDVFTSVVQIDSYENYREWYDKVRCKLNATNINYLFVDGLMANWVQEEVVSSRDLVFIDDSYTARERALTIDAVIKFKPKLCVIHDFENIKYRWSLCRAREKYFRFKSILPNVGVFGSNADFEIYKKIDSIIARYSPGVPNNSVTEWLNIFKSEFSNE